VELIETVGQTYEQQLERNAALEALAQQKLTLAQRLQQAPAVVRIFKLIRNNKIQNILGQRLC